MRQVSLVKRDISPPVGKLKYPVKTVRCQKYRRTSEQQAGRGVIPKESETLVSLQISLLPHETL